MMRAPQRRSTTNPLSTKRILSVFLTRPDVEPGATTSGYASWSTIVKLSIVSSMEVKTAIIIGHTTRVGDMVVSAAGTSVTLAAAEWDESVCKPSACGTKTAPLAALIPAVAQSAFGLGERRGKAFLLHLNFRFSEGSTMGFFVALGLNGCILGDNLVFGGTDWRC